MSRKLPRAVMEAIEKYGAAKSKDFWDVDVYRAELEDAILRYGDERAAEICEGMLSIGSPPP